MYKVYIKKYEKQVFSRIYSIKLELYRQGPVYLEKGSHRSPIYLDTP